VSQRHFVDVVALEHLRESYVTRFDVSGRAVILTHTADGIHAFDGTCTHANFQFVTSRLAGGCDIECPMHGACFDAVTGEPTSGPAERALTQLNVQIENGMVRVDAPWVVQTSDV
jgi:3-phenylpropionate/trans-cinnamate dioxygenase ferredoxin component